MKLDVLLYGNKRKGYWAEVPALPGCFTQAATMDELIPNIYEAVEGYLKVCEEENYDKKKTQKRTLDRKCKTIKMIV